MQGRLITSVSRKLTIIAAYYVTAKTLVLSRLLNEAEFAGHQSSFRNLRNAMLKTVIHYLPTDIDV